MMISDLTSFRLRDAHPEVIIRPELPLDMDLFVGLGAPGSPSKQVNKLRWQRYPRSTLRWVLLLLWDTFRYNTRTLQMREKNSILGEIDYGNTDSP
jgi:hypothetical protein